MMNTTSEILPFSQETSHDLKESQATSVTLLRRHFSQYQLEVSRDANGRLRGWVTSGKTREVKLKGLPAYLTFPRATQLLKQSYLKFQKEAIEVLPKGLGGGTKHSRPSSALESTRTTTCEKEALKLVETIPNNKNKRIVRKVVEVLLKNDLKKLMQSLDFAGNQIGDARAQALGATLQINHTLQSLDLAGNQIGIAGAQALGAALQINHTLQSLDLHENAIGDTGAEALGSALQVNQSLQSLNLGYTQIGNVGIQALRDALQVNQSLQSLNLGGNQIDDDGVQMLGAALEVNQSLQSLNLRYTQIGNVGIQTLGTALQVNQSLQSLNLEGNQIDDDGVQMLRAALEVNQSLQSLNLEWNHGIGDAGAEAIGVALEVNQSLQVLNLSKNRISDTGAQALGKALQVNRSLQSLNLGDNLIGDDGAQALGIILQVNHTLQVLNLEWNYGLGNTSAQTIGFALQVNQSLQVLNLSNNRIHDVGAQAIGAALQVNQSLQSLNLGGNLIGNDGAQALGTALEVNYTLELLNLANNRINTKRIENRINTLLQANKQIATTFQQQIKEVQQFLQLHQNNEDIPLEHLLQLKELLQKWHADPNDLIPSLQEILKQSGRPNLNDRYKEKLEGIITNLTNRLYDLWLESFEKKIVALSNEYVMGKESSNQRNVNLGYALYEIWLTFLGSDCPNWVEDHLQSLIPFGVLLDIAEGGRKKDVTDLTAAHSLFERVLSFRNESKDSLLSLTNQSQKLC